MNVVKYLQAQGISSRKGCQSLIEQGAVVINHEIIGSIKEEISPELVQSLQIREEAHYVVPVPYCCILMNKPTDFEVSQKPRDYSSIFSLFPGQMRNIKLQAVGRLDVDTTGLLLFTNDGALNHRLTSPKHQVEKEYLIDLKHPFDLSQQEALLKGVLLHDDNETVKAKSIDILDKNHIFMVITSGKYHQVKRMIAAVGNRVERLHRTRFGKLRMPEDWAFGSWQFIDEKSIID